MSNEIELMKACHEFEISRIKSQLLADVTIKIIEKYDFITRQDVEEIAKKARILVYSAFNGKLKEEGGAEC